MNSKLFVAVFTFVLLYFAYFVVTTSLVQLEKVDSLRYHIPMAETFMIAKQTKTTLQISFVALLSSIAIFPQLDYYQKQIIICLVAAGILFVMPQKIAKFLKTKKV